MEVGDRVQMLRGTEKGVVLSLVGKDRVRIETEDGLPMEVLRRDLIPLGGTQTTSSAPVQHRMGMPDKPKVAPVRLGKERMVDLHAEAITQHQVDTRLALSMQLRALEHALESAIEDRIHELIVIHGKGDGTLRRAVHNRLHKVEEISYFGEILQGPHKGGGTLIRFGRLM